MKAHVHYEAAFQDYLLRRQVPYVAVDELRRAAFRDAKLKSFDFIVYSAQTTNWLVDIKGRRFPGGERGRRSWQNWATQADLDGLAQWQQVFGQGFRALLLFAYWIDGGDPPPTEIVHDFRDARYVFVGVPLDDYRVHARVRSPRWGTVNVPVAEFAKMMRPVSEWL